MQDRGENELKFFTLRANRILSWLLVVEFGVIAVCLVLTLVGIFDVSVLWPVCWVLIAAVPATLVALFTLVGRGSADPVFTGHVLCVFACVEAAAVCFFVYSFAGTFCLLVPILAAAFYPRSRNCAVVSAVMLALGVLMPPLSCIAGFWDGPYYQELMDLSDGVLYACTDAGVYTVPARVYTIIRYISGQNLIFVGAVTVIGQIIYRRTNRSCSDHEEIVRLSETDVLTGLLNRNCFEKRMEMLSSLEKQSTACFYFDANGLHELNNREGHKAGDVMLQYIGRRIQEKFGENKAFRVGGDEYVAFVSGDRDLQQTKETLEAAFAAHGYHVAIGYAESTGAADLQQLVSLAEKEMYRSKREFYMANDRRRGARTEDGEGEGT